MKNLDASFTGKTLEDLKPVDLTGGSNLIEPTKAEIVSMWNLMKDGKPDQEIKKEFRRAKDGKRLGFSFGQLREIRAAWRGKIAELTPPPVEVN